MVDWGALNIFDQHIVEAATAHRERHDLRSAPPLQGMVQRSLFHLQAEGGRKCTVCHHGHEASTAQLVYFAAGQDTRFGIQL
jgi:hypothetical protein